MAAEMQEMKEAFAVLLNDFTTFRNHAMPAIKEFLEFKNNMTPIISTLEDFQAAGRLCRRFATIGAAIMKAVAYIVIPFSTVVWVYDKFRDILRHL